MGWAQGHRDRLAGEHRILRGAYGIISPARPDTNQGYLILLKVDNGRIRPLEEGDLPEMDVVEQDFPILKLYLHESDLSIEYIDSA